VYVPNLRITIKLLLRRTLVLLNCVRAIKPVLRYSAKNSW